MTKISKQILIIAAHPDDELLGAGATMARHAAQGDDVHVVIAAQGATSRYSSNEKNQNQALTEINSLKQSAIQAAKVLGTQEPIFLDFPDNQLDSIILLNIIQKIEDAIERIKPQIIYTHHGGDLNIDHNIVHRAVITAARPLPHSSIESIYTFETLSSTEWFSPQQQFPFVANRFVDIENFFDTKIEALKCYDNEMRTFPHPRSMEALEALAKLRGANSGLKMAEAFFVCRDIFK